MGRPGRPKKEKTKIIYIRLPDSVAKAIEKRASDERRGLSATICLILEASLK